MKNKIATFVFKNRKFFTITAYVIPTALKLYLHGTTTLLFLIIGLIIVVLGITLRIYSAGYMLGKHIVTTVGADHLCTDGPFAYVRNPLYVGNILVGIGTCISLNEWYGYAIIILHYIVMYIFIIPHEEKFLHNKFGNVYVEYKNNIRRFIPKLQGYRNNVKVIFNLKLGFLSEKYFTVVLLINILIIYFLFVK
jgi:protein-S-isoprenylcysteine O-methyltransferase Ste14